MNRNEIYPCKFDEVLKKIFFFVIALHLNKRMNKSEEMIDKVNAKIIG